jgi:hypothetical protein
MEEESNRLSRSDLSGTDSRVGADMGVGGEL